MGHTRNPSLRNEIVLRFRLPATYCFVVIAMVLLSPANSYATPYYDLNGYVAAYALPTSPCANNRAQTTVLDRPAGGWA